MTITLYGIKNCDTMKKARSWLDTRGVKYDFHDYRTAGIDRERLERWCEALGWEKVLNRAGTTFRNLPEAGRTDLNTRKAVALMLAQPAMIKRPILDLGGPDRDGPDPDQRLLAGFKPETYEAAMHGKRSGPQAVVTA